MNVPSGSKSFRVFLKHDDVIWMRQETEDVLQVCVTWNRRAERPDDQRHFILESKRVNRGEGGGQQNTEHVWKYTTIKDELFLLQEKYHGNTRKVTLSRRRVENRKSFETVGVPVVPGPTR